MLTYLHNNRCSKSRAGIKIMEKSGKKYILREYLTNPLDFQELEELQTKLGIQAIDFTRTGEKEFKQAGLTRDSTNTAILKAMSKFPKLMERPIIFSDTCAIIGRPEQNISNFIKR